jgi:hypothetical protein
MNAKTRIHNNIDGSVVTTSSHLDFGTITQGSVSETKVISLNVEGVKEVANIQLEIVTSDSVDVRSGAFRYFTSKVFTRLPTLPQSFKNSGDKIRVRNLTPILSEYVFINIDTRKTDDLGSGNVSFRWTFDLVEVSSSSSSSSSNSLGSVIQISPGSKIDLVTEVGDTFNFVVNLAPTEYATINFDGTDVPIENRGGVFYVDGISFLTPGTVKIVTVNGRSYEIRFVSFGSFIVAVEREDQPCASFPLNLEIDGYSDGDLVPGSGFETVLYALPFSGLLIKVSDEVCDWLGEGEAISGVPIPPDAPPQLVSHLNKWSMTFYGEQIDGKTGIIWRGEKMNIATPEGIYTRTEGADTGTTSLSIVESTS